jgi:hypothetical protein
MSCSEPAQHISFEETQAGASLDWHNASHRQYVITLSGRLEFETPCYRLAMSREPNILEALGAFHEPQSS